MDNSVRDSGQAAIARCVSAVMRSRHAVRAFKPRPLDRKLVEDVLQDAAAAPSGANIQPWRVYVVTGTVKEALADALLAASRAGSVPAPAHFPDPLPDVFHARLKPHSWIDLGLFAQNVMIAAKARGIDTCPQVSFAPFHEVIATQLQLEPCEVTAFGMSMGYGDPHAPVNQVAMPRERVRDFARLVGFPEEHAGR